MTARSRSEQWLAVERALYGHEVDPRPIVEIQASTVAARLVLELGVDWGPFLPTFEARLAHVTAILRRAPPEELAELYYDNSPFEVDDDSYRMLGEVV